MEQRYHFIKSGTKLLGITLVVFVFMKWILPMVLPFFIAYYIASLVRGAKEKEKRNPILRLFLTIGIIGLVIMVGWYLSQEFLELWSRREELLYWEGAEESGLIGQLYQKLVQQFDGEHLSDELIRKVASPFGGMRDTLGGFVAVAVTAVATVLMIGEYDALREKLHKNALGQVIVALGKDLSVAGGDYLRAQGWIMLIITGICILALFLVGNPYAVLVGIAIGICDALPFIGTSLVFVPWAIVMFFQGSIWLGIYYLILAGGTSLLRQFLEPKFIGHRVGANPLAVLISIYLGLQFYGIWGVVLGPASAFLIWEIYRFT
ncbi:MAG: AI-2E family transporter [Lachnospiraceae bacterium]|nr:AI-2E family transporter [Lachnospiraceae bacterium]